MNNRDVNNLGGVAALLQGLVGGYTTAKGSREAIVRQLEAEKRKRMQQESGESYRMASMTPGITLPEAQQASDFMGQTVDEPDMRMRALQAAEMMGKVPSEEIGAGLAGPEGMGPWQSAQTVLSKKEASLIPGAKVAEKIRRRQPGGDATTFYDIIKEAGSRANAMVTAQIPTLDKQLAPGEKLEQAVQRIYRQNFLATARSLMQARKGGEPLSNEELMQLERSMPSFEGMAPTAGTGLPGIRKK